MVAILMKKTTIETHQSKTTKAQ